MKNLTDSDCLHTNEWYTCTFSIFIFLSFLFLFIYSLIVLGFTSNLLMENDFSSETYHVDIREIMTTYILNIIITFISILVLCYFLFQLLPKHFLSIFMNQYLVIVFASFIIAVSSVTIHYYRQIENFNTAGVITIASIALVLSILLIVFYSVRILYHSKQNPKKRSIH